jgi:hypothetical protein
MIGTLPGRTQGLGLITEPLLRDSRSTASRSPQINLVATLVGALFCIGIGKLIDRSWQPQRLDGDRIGPWHHCLGMSQARRVLAMLIAVTLTRRVWSERALGREPRDDRQMVPSTSHDGDGDLCARDEHGIHGGIPSWSARSCNRRDGGVAWAAIGLCLGVGWHRSRGMFENRSHARNQSVSKWDGGGVSQEEQQASGVPGDAWRSAGRSPALSWVFALASAVYGLVASGIGLLNESILVERDSRPTSTTRHLP